MKQPSERYRATGGRAAAPGSLEPDWLGEYGFGVDAPDDLWLERLRLAETPAVLGRIGAYELEEEVSRGGQGIVFRARQPGTNRRIALKRMLAGSFATEGMHRRFEREVEAAALLNHPNIVTVYGVETIDETPVFAMEWVDGVPATEWAAGRAPEEVLELFLRICDAVRHAHSRGVLHRDLKPSNILVDEAGQPHVLDFGLAKHCPLGDDDALGSVSKSAEVFGTPAYASPEQLRGSATRLDARTDVYSLGVLLYELLVAKSPYGEWDSVADLLRRVGERRPPRVSASDPRLDARLDTIVRTAMASDVADRYGSVNLLGADVRSYLSGDPIAAAPLSTLALATRLIAKNPVVSALGAAVAVLSVCFGIYAQVQSERLRGRVVEAEAARDDAFERERRTAALLAFTPDCLLPTAGAISPLVAKPGTILDRSLAFSSPNPFFEPAETDPDVPPTASVGE